MAPVTLEEIQTAKWWVKLMLGADVTPHPAMLRDVIEAYREWKRQTECRA